MLTNLFFDKTHFDRMVTNLIFDKTHFDRNGLLHVRIDILNSKNASMNFVTNVPSYMRVLNFAILKLASQRNLAF